jgi:hypothetical protein
MPAQATSDKRSSLLGFVIMFFHYKYIGLHRASVPTPGKRRSCFVNRNKPAGKGSVFYRQLINLLTKKALACKKMTTFAPRTEKLN